MLSHFDIFLMLCEQYMISFIKTLIIALTILGEVHKIENLGTFFLHFLKVKRLRYTLSKIKKCVFRLFHQLNDTC